MLKRLLKFIGFLVGGLLALVLVLATVWYQADVPVSELEPKYFTPESRYVMVGEEKVHVRDIGKGTPLFLLHGSFASLHTWAGWQTNLSQHFRTISIDLPGHGLTGPSATNRYTTNDYGQLVFDLADQLQIDTFHVAGNSMGGQVAWQMALRNPTRVKKMVLVDAAGFWQLPGTGDQKQSHPFIFKLLQTDWIANLLVKITPKFLFRQNLKQVYGNPTKVKKENVDRFFDLMMREGNRTATLQRLRQRGKDLQDSIAMIQSPTLILWGEKDAWIPVANAQRFHKAINSSQLHIFPQAGHVPMEEIPEESAQVALDFLQYKPREQRQQ
ncbi:MAG: alpha/beta fold hydrolase [Flammeovirgaceae bacterium]